MGPPFVPFDFDNLTLRRIIAAEAPASENGGGAPHSSTVSIDHSHQAPAWPQSQPPVLGRHAHTAAVMEVVVGYMGATRLSFRLPLLVAAAVAAIALAASPVIAQAPVGTISGVVRD